MAKPKHDRVEIVISPLMDAILTGIYFFEILATLYIFYTTFPENHDVALFLLFCFLVYVAIKLTTVFSETVCRGFLSKYILNSGPNSDPLSSSITFHKFTGCLWQLVIHASMTILEIYVLFDTCYFSHVWSTFTPLDYVPELRLRYLYLIQTAIWVSTCWSHRFNSDAHAHKDYIPMYVHHLATIALVILSYWYNQTRIGAVVLFIHDASDIGIDFLKICNYLYLEDIYSCFVIYLAYVANIFMWCYFRLWYLPVYILGWGTIFHMGFYRDHPLGVLPLYFAFPNDQRDHYVVLGIIISSLLGILVLLHVWWGWLLLRIVLRFSQHRDPHRSGAETYEGGSDDEFDEDDVDHGKTKKHIENKNEKIKVD